MGNIPGFPRNHIPLMEQAGPPRLRNAEPVISSERSVKGGSNAELSEDGQGREAEEPVKQARIEVLLAFNSVRGGGRPSSVLHSLAMQPWQTSGELAGRLLVDPVVVETSLNTLIVAEFVVCKTADDGYDYYGISGLD